METPQDITPSVNLSSAERFKALQLPETDIKFTVINQVREGMIMKAVIHNQKQLREVGNFFENKGAELKEDVKRQLEEEETEIQECEQEIEELTKAVKEEKETLEFNKKYLETAIIQVEKKQCEMSAIDGAVDTARDEMKEAQKKVEEQTKIFLAEVAKKITEQTVKDFHTALISQNKDEKKIQLANAFVSLLKNEPEVDIIVVNVKTLCLIYRAI